MIDKITIQVNIEAGNKWYEQIGYDTHTGKDHYTGHIKNIKIMQNLDGVVLRGSIAKYLNGENVSCIDRNQVREALELLQADTKIDLSAGIVRGVEFGLPVIVQNPVADYLELFDYMPVYTRGVYGRASVETVSYFTPSGGFGFCAYDKAKEIQDRKKEMPPLFHGCNVLRLEYRIKNRTAIKNKFGQDITPFELADFEKYELLKKEFYQFYSRIPKTGRQVFVNMAQALTPAKIETLCAEAYRQQNSEVFSSLVSDGVKQGFISDKSLERIRAQARKNGQDYTFSDRGALQAELDEKTRLMALC